MAATDEAQRGGNAASQRAKAALEQAQQGGGAPAAGGGRQYSSIMEAFQDPEQKKQIELALPRALDIDRFARICVTQVRNNANLGKCTVISLLGACMQAAQLGLEPGVLGQAYLVPFYNSKERQHDVQFIVGYQGYIELFHRSGKLDDIVAREVCENDYWKYSYGIDDHMEHIPAEVDRGKPKVYYGLARLKGGGHNLHVMNIQEIGERRERSRAKDAGPWQTDEIPMSRKTVIRAMSAFLPKSAMVAAAMAADETIAMAITPDMANDQPYIDVDSSEENAADTGPPDAQAPTDAPPDSGPPQE